MGSAIRPGPCAHPGDRPPSTFPGSLLHALRRGRARDSSDLVNHSLARLLSWIRY
jgi:hypothetical protein